MLTRRAFLSKSILGAGALTAWSVPGVRAVSHGLSSLAGQGAAKKKIVVLGAGVAGMVAALELTSAGHDVTILEANTRPGGRVYTLREPFSDGLFAEAGAGRIPDWHELTHRYIKLCGLETEPFQPDTGKSVLFLRGQRYELNSEDELPLANLPFALSSEERTLTLDGLQKRYVDPILQMMGDPASPSWPSPQMAELDSRTWGEELRRRGASAGAVDLLLAINGFQTDSALDYFRDDLGHRGAKSLSRIKGGNDRLPHALAAKLAGQIVYGADVVRIQRDAESAWISFRQAGLQRALLANCVICTIPFSVLRHIEVAPAWPAQKQEVIQKLVMDPVVRVFAQTRSRFWEAKGLNGWASTDAPTAIWQPTFSQPGRRGILHTYPEDGEAVRIAGLSAEERNRQGIAEMQRVFPDLPEHLESVYQWSWLDDPYARGAYVVFQAGQTLPWGKIAREPVGRVYFAGEHTSHFSGWIQGAIESGLRVTHEVHAAA